MSNWNGAARTNYVRALPTLALALEAWSEIEIVHDGQGKFAPLSNTEDGDWPGFSEVDGCEIEFSFEDWVMPHIEVGEILIAMVAGHEKLRYVTGQSTAYRRDEAGMVHRCQVNLRDIYELAADEFEVETSSIGLVLY